MSGKRYTEEFRIEAAKQVTDRGFKGGDLSHVALWRRKPEGKVLIHSDQGIQYTCAD